MGVGDRRYNLSDLQDILDLAGIPELEVKSSDERGRLEFGDLKLVPRLELDSVTRQKLEAFKVNDGEFKQVYLRKKRMPKDNTWSGYAMSLCIRLVKAEFSDQEVINIVDLHRREHGDPHTKPRALGWFLGRLAKAHSAVKEQQELAKKHEDQAAKKKVAAEREATERVLIGQICTGDTEAQKALKDLLELDVRRLVQISNDVEPTYRLELADGRIVHVPSLAAVTSFAAFNRYVWRYLRIALPSKAQRQWRAVCTALGQLICIEDTGLNLIELTLCDLGEYFASASHSLFEKYPVAEHPNGPPRDDHSFYGWHGCAVHAIGAAEYDVALSLLAEPRRSNYSISGIYHTKTEDADVAEITFTAPPLFDWAKKHRDRKYDFDEFIRRLHAAGFRYRDTTIIDSHRLRRVWSGELNEGTVDEHQYFRPDDPMSGEEWHAHLADMKDQIAKGTVQ